MKNFLKTGKILALGSSLGLCFPFGGQISFGQEAARKPTAKVKKVQEFFLDVTLQEQGALRGAVVETNGKAAAKVKVSLRKDGKDISQADTDKEGRFVFATVKPGMYTLIAIGPTGQTRKVLRVWPNGSGPPKATSVAVVALDSRPVGDVVRGQFGTGPGPFGLSIMGTALLAGGLIAAVAIPLAVANDDGTSTPASP